MNNTILFNNEVRDTLLKGINTLANAVKITLGPKGKNVIIDNINKDIHVTKDGVTVANNININNNFQNSGIKLIKHVAAKTGKDVGDGTTTATVLAQAIINESVKNITAGAKPIDLIKGIEKAVNCVINFIKNNSIIIENNYEIIENIATISANNDTFIGNLIKDIIYKISKDGIIILQESKNIDTNFNIIEGFQFDKGYTSSYFINNLEQTECVLENTKILICDKNINNVNQIIDIMQNVIQNDNSLLIIAEDISNDVLNNIIYNKINNNIKICVVKTPSFGNYRKDILEDISIITGGTVICNEKGLKLENANIYMLGSCDKVIITKNNTTIINGHGDKNNINLKINQIKNNIKLANTEYEKNKLKNRLSSLIGKMAIINVGAASEVEIKEKKDRIDDALCATRAAIEEGIVAGGGVTYIRAIDALEDVKGDNADETTGIEIIKRAIEEPLRQIVANAGKEGAVVVQKVREGEGDFGYNARTDVYENLYDAGVVDPAKVTRVALENASSIAKMFILTDCLVLTDK